jgi:hypothetical protein
MGGVDFTTLLYKEEKKPSAVWIIELGILLSTYFSMTEFSEKFFKLITITWDFQQVHTRSIRADET